jgi:subtilase family serine protease
MRPWKFVLPLLATSLCFAAQPDRITGTIDSSQMVTVPKSLHPEAKPQYDQGPVDPSLKLSYVTLLMAPSPSQQAALDQLLVQQQDPKSTNYHKWLTPQQFADNFGLSQGDLSKVTAWLNSHGFQVLSVGGGRNTIVFSGTAAQAQSAFKTEIHNYKVHGREHFANSTPLMIPSALDGIVSSVMGLHSFFPKPASQVRGAGGVRNSRPNYYDSEFVFPNFLAPDDVATIYNIAPLYEASTSIDGTGQTLGIIGQTDIYLADIDYFRSGFSLNQITGCTTNANGIITACNSTYFRYVLLGSDPGTPSTCGDLSEADLDIEWSGATARNAQIIFFNSPVTFNSNCTGITSGGGVNAALIAAINPSSGSPLASVLSMSYGECEAGADNLETVLQQGNAEGITIVNSAGDQGAAACDYSPPDNAVDPPFSPAVNGLAVSYPASSQYVTGVGGTSISLANDSYPTQSSYWSTTLGANGGTAVSYIPEQPWDDVEQLADYCHDPASGDKFCSQGGSSATPNWVPLTTTATAAQVQSDIWISAGGGGASNCFYENGSVCLGAGAGPSGGGLAQPSYQQNLHVPSAPAGVRYVPDVSLLASPDFPGYIFCTPESELGNTSNTTSSCAGGITNALNNGTYVSAIGGTSVSSPIFAGIVTLLNQSLGSNGLGNINPTLYSLAATPSNLVFHSITSGDNDVYCQKNTPSGYPINVMCPNAGVMGFSASNTDPTTGYNLVTGLGSVDANNLATEWPSRTSSSIMISPSATNVMIGSNVTFTAKVTPSTGVGSVSFSTLNGGSATVLGTATLNTPYPPSQSGTATFTTSSLPAGSNSVTATYEGDASNNGATSAAAAITVTVPFTLSPNPATLTVAAGQSVTSVITVTPVNGFTGAVNFNSGVSPAGGCTAGLPSGATCTFSPSSVTNLASGPQQVTLTIATSANMALPSGAQALTVAGTSGSAVVSVSPTLTVTATTQTFGLASTGAATYPVAAGATASVPITVTGTNGFIVGSGTTSTTALSITYSCLQSSIPSEVQCVFSPGSGNSINNTSLTLSLKTTAPTSQLRPLLGHGNRIFYALLLPGLFGIVLASGSPGRGVRLLSLIVVLGFSTLWLGSCSSSGGSNGGQSNPGTPAGTYAIVVNAATAGPNALTAAPLTITLVVTN